MKNRLIPGRIQARTIILCGMMVLSLILAAFAYQTEERADDAIEHPNGEISILIRLDERVLYLFCDGQVWKQYPIAVGKIATPSPIGEWQIVWKDADWGTGFGTRWMGLDVPWGTFGIHGTNKPWSIGTRTSHGCIRMQNRDVEELYEWTPLGTNVKIEGHASIERGELRPSMTGQSVVSLQLRLRELGYLNGRADGRYGSQVKAAVEAYQRDHGLAVTGMADRELLEEMGLTIVQ